MADQKLTGHDYTTPDLVAKVTGRAKYAEDYRADGMLFTKLLLSPMPHARVRRIDTAAALAMPGVKAILTADDLPDLRGAERALTNEPLYQGEPILAVAAVDERTAAEAIERITIDLEPLPFVVDPVESLRPTGANARLDGNVWIDAARSTRHAATASASESRDAQMDGRGLRRARLTAGCRSARRPTNGRTATSTPVSKRRRSSWTKRSSCSRPGISRWNRAARWRTGRAASCTCTPRRKA